MPNKHALESLDQCLQHKSLFSKKKKLATTKPNISLPTNKDKLIRPSLKTIIN